MLRVRRNFRPNSNISSVFLPYSSVIVNLAVLCTACQKYESLVIMLRQRQRNFTLDGGCSLRSVNFVKETDSSAAPLPLPAAARTLAVRAPLAVRVKENVLNRGERKLLDWMCARI